MNKIKMTCLAAMIGFTSLVTLQAPANAASAQMTPLSSIASAVPGTDGGLLQQVHWKKKSYCRRHPYSKRCRHVRVYSYCKKERWQCAQRWGWNSWRYRRCVRYHGC